MSQSEGLDINEQMSKELDRLRQSNADKFGALSRQNRMIPPLAILATRLEAFINTFIPESDRTAFELNFESAVQDMLNEGLAQLRQATLLEGVQGVNPKKLITGK